MNSNSVYLGNVDILDLQIIEHIRHRLECHKLPCANILLTLQDGTKMS